MNDRIFTTSTIQTYAKLVPDILTQDFRQILMTEKQANQVRTNRGIYLLPNLLTTAGLFSGFYAVVSSMNGHFAGAAIAIFIAMIFDGLDGRVARMTNTQSEFGAEYDSMADMVSFGVAPALVAYNWGLSDMGKLGWLAAFIYVAGAALRLARFNTQVGIADKRFFQGLASPAAAARCFLAQGHYVACPLLGWLAVALAYCPRPVV